MNQARKAAFGLARRKLRPSLYVLLFAGLSAWYVDCRRCSSSMDATNREALVKALENTRSASITFASTLQAGDENFVALLQSAAKNIKSAIEWLTSTWDDLPSH